MYLFVHFVYFVYIYFSSFLFAQFPFCFSQKLYQVMCLPAVTGAVVGPRSTIFSWTACESLLLNRVRSSTLARCSNRILLDATDLFVLIDIDF